MRKSVTTKFAFASIYIFFTVLLIIGVSVKQGECLEDPCEVFAQKLSAHATIMSSRRMQPAGKIVRPALVLQYFTHAWTKTAITPWTPVHYTALTSLTGL